MAKRWPIVFPGYELICFLDTKVACQRIVVMPTNKLCPDNFRDIGEALVVQNAIDIVPTFWVLCLGLLGLLIFGLQFV